MLTVQKLVWGGTSPPGVLGSCQLPSRALRAPGGDNSAQSRLYDVNKRPRGTVNRVIRAKRTHPPAPVPCLCVSIAPQAPDYAIAGVYLSAYYAP
jgi:hypothetical protein